LYTACAALRLARFNTQVGMADKRYFQGLASPAAAGLAMSFVWAATEHVFDQRLIQILAPAISIVAGLLMVSRVRYYSFKAWPLSDRVPFFWIPLVVLILIALAMEPSGVLLAIAAVYVLSGPALTLWGLRLRREKRDSTRAEERVEK